MKERRATGKFGSSSRSLRRKQKHSFWTAVVVGLVISLIIGGLLYLINKPGKF